ncbi:MAG: DNA-processing protein DprA [Elusimicrobia bacterium]|nr:DNA-processing protein DprA [Elusimicrobiota bacterium]
MYNVAHNELQARVLLNMVEGVGPIRANRLVSYFGGAVKIFSSNPAELSIAGEISDNLAKRILSSGDVIDADAEIEAARGMGVRIVTAEEIDYPPPLKHLNDPPVVLYVRGEFKKEDVHSVGIVGTRRPTQYGKLVTEKLTREFAELGTAVVSGLARGIDTIAHSVTLKSCGRTFAVMGNGLGVHYPPENRKLEDSITKSGALVSEFPLNCKPDRGNFPRRNRLIAALSLGVIVVEADEKSGALITARFALEQGKDVFAVPGSILSRYSRGPHILLKNGAKLVESAADVVDEISVLGDWIIKNAKKEKAALADTGLPILTSTEEVILDRVSMSPAGINIDMLFGTGDVPFGKLSEALMSLEMKGMIKALPGKAYIRT